MSNLPEHCEQTPEDIKEAAIINFAAALNVIEMSYGEDSDQMLFLDSFLDRIKAITPKELVVVPEGFGAYNQMALIINYLAQNDPNTIMALIQQSLLMTQMFICSWETTEEIDQGFPEDQIMHRFEFSMGVAIQMAMRS